MPVGAPADSLRGTQRVSPVGRIEKKASARVVACPQITPLTVRESWWNEYGVTVMRLMRNPLPRKRGRVPAGRERAPAKPASRYQFSMAQQSTQ
jgi:hypothetical protein